MFYIIKLIIVNVLVYIIYYILTEIWEHSDIATTKFDSGKKHEQANDQKL